MKSHVCFLVEPKGKQYDNKVIINGFEFTTSASIEEAKDVNRTGVVLETPINYDGDISVGDEIILHHNIFREFYDIKGNRKYSKSYFREGVYLVYPDLVYLYKKDNEWITNEDYIFVKPIKEFNKITNREEIVELFGEIVYGNGDYSKGTKISFTPESEYEVKVDGEPLYRMRIRDISLVA